jgi:hypothetical protein
MHPLLVKKENPCVKFEKATREKYIYSLFHFLNLMSEHHRDAALLKMIFIKQNLKAFGFTTHESLLFYENLFYIRNQEINESNVPKNIHKLLTPEL